MIRLAVLTLALAASVPGSRFPVLGSGSQGSPFSVRFHHVHYSVGDPSAAMAETVATLGGVRQVVQGLGVGVKVGDVFVLFDREEKDAGTRPVAEDYAAALAWLKDRGVTVDAGTPQLPFAAGADHVAFATSHFDALVARLGTPVKRSSEAALFDGGSVLVEIVRETELPDAYWCPMHPDVRSATTGKCPLCAMDLVPIPPPKIGEYKLDVAVRRSARGARGLTLAVREPDTNALVREFATVHEKILHLFIVSRDLEYFAHVHPEHRRDGSFVLTHGLPPGEYMVIADFLPAGGTAQMVQRAVVVGQVGSSVKGKGTRDKGEGKRDKGEGRRDKGEGRRDKGEGRRDKGEGTRDKGEGKRDKGEASDVVVDGLRVRLKAEDVVAGKDACLTFTVTDASTGAPITDLEPLLGAPAHMLLVRADLSDAVHAHPEELTAGGPTVSFHPLIPAPGDYKLWIQFQRRGTITTVPFRLRAN